MITPGRKHAKCDNLPFRLLIYNLQPRTLGINLQAKHMLRRETRYSGQLTLDVVDGKKEENVDIKSFLAKQSNKELLSKSRKIYETSDLNKH